MSERTKLAQDILIECAKALDEKTNDGYTDVQLDCHLQNGTPTLRWRSYQSNSSWTGGHPTWEQALAEATSAEFLPASIMEDIRTKEAELAALRSKLKGQAV